MLDSSRGTAAAEPSEGFAGKGRPLERRLWRGKKR